MRCMDSDDKEIDIDKGELKMARVLVVDDEKLIVKGSGSVWNRMAMR